MLEIRRLYSYIWSIMIRKRRTSPKSEKSARGPKGKYNSDIPLRAYKLSLIGLTEAELAIAFDVHESTIDNWKCSYPEFRAALASGKTEADSNVANAMYRRAVGYSHPDTQFFKVYNKETKSYEIIPQKLIKHYPPDTTACIFWLKNRQRDKWSDVHKLEHEGHVNTTVDLSDATKEELKFLAKIGLKMELEDE